MDIKNEKKKRKEKKKKNQNTPIKIIKELKN